MAPTLQIGQNVLMIPAETEAMVSPLCLFVAACKIVRCQSWDPSRGSLVVDEDIMKPTKQTTIMITYKLHEKNDRDDEEEETDDETKKYISSVSWKETPTVLDHLVLKTECQLTTFYNSNF